MAKNKTLYLADDDPDDRMMLIDAIRSIDSDIVIIEAENGNELLEILQSEKHADPGLIILDVNMPKMNGLETLAKLRCLPQIMRVPTVMLSTSNNPQTRQEAKNLGALHYFFKPARIQDLMNLARQLVLGVYPGAI